jgi:O-antigen/teichoic acid export membrane protein
LLGGVVALGTSLWGLEHLPGLSFWLAVLAPVLVTTCLGRIFEAWFWARGRIAPSVLIPAIGDIARTVGLAVAFFILPTKAGVATAVVVGALVPLLIWSTVAPLDALRRPSWIARGDVGYGLKAMLAKATNDGTHQLDVIMIGILATAAATADYAVAARLAALVGLIKGLLVPVLTPRLGRYSAFGSREVLLREYDQVRLFGLVAALLCASLFAAFGRPVLAVFGDYEPSYPLLMVLAAGHVVSAGFGSNAAFLTISGHAGWTLVARLALLAAIIVLTLVLVPAMGAMGAALSMAIGMAVVNVLLCYIIWRLDRLPTISPELIVLLGAAYGLLLLAGFDALDGPVVALGLIALTGVLLVAQAPLWLPVAKRLVARRARARPAE